MRFTLFTFLALCLLAFVLANPAKDTKKPATNACNRSCGDTYEPVCAKAKNSSKERLISFGSKCVMDNYNCQHADDPFEIKSKGECGGGVSVRLS
ncbi:vasotab-TY1 [Drosophila sulfurigaster albostrigata]|uniref:vasotab-TY1 n=1 Tax=Drosophila sulfurigaster albostrigata TaxID=89887 RepID=UPI002D21D37C|nr:vasotab-TY1 [Drosophila sulfurigaster albostrigata]